MKPIIRSFVIFWVFPISVVSADYSNFTFKNASNQKFQDPSRIFSENPQNPFSQILFSKNPGNESNLANSDSSESVGNASLVEGEVAEPGFAPSSEEERLWSIVKADSVDCHAWTALIEETEKVAEGNIMKIRKVYDAFLAEFPLYYGYWARYADHEVRIGAMSKVVEVYERAVQRGLAYVGSDYMSSPLWDKYIEYEYLQQEWGRLAVIYTKILENPIQNVDRYFSSFKELAEARPLSELRCAEETATIDAAAAESVLSDSGRNANKAQFHIDVSPAHSPEPETAGLMDAEEVKKYVAIREHMYKKAKEFEAKIIGFEMAIRRPYFHPWPLGIEELENWHNYLDFIEKDGDFNKVVKLYERCLMACANYPEYWISYVSFMEESERMDLAENALARATQIFVKRQPEIHFFDARFKERNGDIAGARAAYRLVYSEIAPGFLEAIIRHANMEHRLGNLDYAFSLYEQAIATEKGKEHSSMLPVLYVQCARFSYSVSGDAEKSRKILVEALEHAQPSTLLLQALFYYQTIQPTERQSDRLESLLEEFIMQNADIPKLFLGLLRNKS